MNKLKSLLGALRRTIAGKNKTGESIHGILDLLPIPNQIIAKIAGAGFNGADIKEALTVRNGVALVVACLIVFGVVTVQDITNLFEVFGRILELFEQTGI